jgi:rod shape-determining protein MreC
LPVGTVLSVLPDPEGGPFMVVRVRLAANLDKVEEVLVIAAIAEKEPEMQAGGPSLRAADILAQRLPTVVPKTLPKGGDEPPPMSALFPKKAPASKPAAASPDGSPDKKQAAPGSLDTPVKKVVKPAIPDPKLSAPPADISPPKPSTETKTPDSAAPTDKPQTPVTQESPQ